MVKRQSRRKSKRKCSLAATELIKEMYSKRGANNAPKKFGARKKRKKQDPDADRIALHDLPMIADPDTYWKKVDAQSAKNLKASNRALAIRKAAHLAGRPCPTMDELRYLWKR